MLGWMEKLWPKEGHKIISTARLEDENWKTHNAVWNRLCPEILRLREILRNIYVDCKHDSPLAIVPVLQENLKEEIEKWGEDPDPEPEDEQNFLQGFDSLNKSPQGMNK
jgi:hypothetical protein